MSTPSDTRVDLTFAGRSLERLQAKWTFANGGWIERPFIRFEEPNGNLSDRPAMRLATEAGRKFDRDHTQEHAPETWNDLELVMDWRGWWVHDTSYDAWIAGPYESKAAASIARDREVGRRIDAIAQERGACK